MLTEDERERIQAQGWETDPEIGNFPLFERHGPWWKRGYRLNRRSDGACIFLKNGRCRIHEKFGAAAKPFACRLYPFILVPAGDHWRVGLRFSCPTAARDQGRPLADHETELSEYAELLEQTASTTTHLPAPPALQ